MTTSVSTDQEQHKKDGADLRAILLWGGGLILAGFVALMLTETLVLPADRITRLIPPEAAAYIHGYGPQARIGPFQGAVPAAAKEFAFVAFSEGDGTLSSATLISASEPPPDSLELDQGIYANGDARALELLTEASGVGRVSDPTQADRGMRIMRGTFPIYGYIRSDVIPEIAPIGPETLIFGMGTNGQGVYGAAFPLSSLDRYGMLGYRRPDRRHTRRHPTEIPQLPGSMISYRGPGTRFDPFALFFGGIARASLEKGAPTGNELREAEDAVRTALGEEIGFALRQGQEQHWPDFVMLISGKERVIRLLAALSDYFALAFPVRQTMLLPDGSSVIELVPGPPLPRDILIQTGETMTLGDPQAGSALTVQRIDDRTIALAPDASSLAEWHEEIRTQKPLKTTCQGAYPNDPVLVIERPDLVTAMSPPLSAFVTILDIRMITIHEIGDNDLYFCGK